MIESGCFVLSFKYLSLANAHSIGSLAPVIVVALSAIILKEKVSAKTWIAIFIGFVAAIVSNSVAEFLKHKTKLDDPLDVFACHGLGGITGMLLTGALGSKVVNPLVLDGQFLIQLKGMAFAASYSFIASFIIFKFINYLVPLRVSEADEEEGLDASQHNENYVQGTTLLVQKEGVLIEEVL